MVNQKTVFVCQECGYKAPKWLGRCPDCGSWNSFSEEIAEIKSPNKGDNASFLNMPQRIDNVSMQKELRHKTGLKEFDRVLGGGIVPGSLVLIGGDPGIGKSTLLLQVAQSVSGTGLKTLYISGEESIQQIKMRSQRLSIKPSEIYLLGATCLEHFIDAIKELDPKIIIIDSIQTMFTELLTSSPGSIGQVREVAGRMMNMAKSSERQCF